MKLPKIFSMQQEKLSMDQFKRKEWKDMITIIGDSKPKLYHAIVVWEKPQERLVKCNTDGACKGNPGMEAYDFCLRNSLGDLIYAQAGNIGITTNVEAEMRAILEATKFCVENDINHIVIESDSLLMVKVINKVWKVSWKIT